MSAFLNTCHWSVKHIVPPPNHAIGRVRSWCQVVKKWHTSTLKWFWCFPERWVTDLNVFLFIVRNFNVHLPVIVICKQEVWILSVTVNFICIMIYEKKKWFWKLLMYTDIIFYFFCSKSSINNTMNYHWSVNIWIILLIHLRNRVLMDM